MSSRRAAAAACLIFTSALVAPAAPAQTGDPIVVALMTGFLPGANPGLSILNGKLQTAFSGGGALPPFSSQVFAYNGFAAASAFVAAAGPNAKVVLVGHSFGAEGNFLLATNHLAPLGIDVDLQISVDYVAQASPFAATTPTVPPTVLHALSYFQTSTTLFEPVPSFQINGAARNLNLESVFADTSFVHTSIDDDARFHELVIARVRELFQPAPYPGTGEDLELFCRVDTLNVACTPASGVAVAGVLAQHPTRTISSGQWLTTRTVSGEGDFVGAPFVVVGHVFVTGAPPTPLVPGLATDLDPAVIFGVNPLGFQTWPFLFAPLTSGGFDAQVCWPAGLQGVSILLQTVALAPSAANGLFTTSHGIELRGV
ncbi:MAG TPA: hypothetical protein VEI02_06250 [Planctomycetota bacterium]|nr:hypothetical protein [Planctomycetota bacterium]